MKLERGRWGGGGGRGGGGPSCVLLRAKGIVPGTIIFVFILFMLCFIVGEGNGPGKTILVSWGEG